LTTPEIAIARFSAILLRLIQMRGKMRQLIAGSIFAACVLLGNQAANAQGNPVKPLDPAAVSAASIAIATLLDGRTFSVDTGKQGKPAAGKDVVRFADGLMSTALCIRFGFKPAPYSVRVEGQRVYFQSEMISETQGKLVFDGHMEGDRLVATAAWEQVRWYWTVNIVLWYDGPEVEDSETLPVFLN
jgi:hypothetical protein